MSAPHRPRDWIVFGPGYSGFGKTRGVKAARADLDFAEQLAEVDAPKVRCDSHAEEWDGRINRCVLDDGHLDYHTDGALLWSDMTALEAQYAPAGL